MIESYFYKEHHLTAFSGQKDPKATLCTGSIGLSYGIDSTPYVFYDTIDIIAISQ